MRIFWIFPAHGKNGPREPQMGPGGFFPAHLNLADMLGRRDFDFQNFYFFYFWGPQLGPGLADAAGAGAGVPTNRFQGP